jgi:hypothetical protein
MVPKRAWISYAGDTTSWLDPRVVDAIRQQLPALADEIVAAIRLEVSEYSDPMSGDFGRGIRLGTEQALRRFIGEGDADSRAVYRTLGYGEHRSGRSLDALQSAYRIGARLAWRSMSRAAAAAGASVEMQHDLAEAMFAYIDQLAGESVEGYAAAQLAHAADSERRRATLLAMLLGPAPVEPHALALAGAQARWPLPRSLACLVVAGEPGPVARRLSGDALHGALDGVACVVVPSPAGLAAQARSAAARLGVRVGVGPAVAPGDARRSLRWATLASQLEGEIGAVLAEQRLADLALRAAPDVVDALRRAVLAPLADESERSRERLAATLGAWLRHRGSQRAVAAELSVHPQTVRYRVARLRELFGEALEDPEGRFELQVALRSSAATRSEPGAA